MTVIIYPRAVWAVYVPADKNPGLASAPPAVSNNADWNPVAGVFIHYRGGDNPLASDWSTEEECMKDIADVFVEHTADNEYNGDIAYNFLICPHGNIYEGRGYQRGEADHAGYVDGYGRNAGFYSICALLRTSNIPSEEMVRSFRALIGHLRTDAPVQTGPRIVPHSFEYDTECPGNMSMYARVGSSIDPAAPWQGLADIFVYRTQKWVNATYASAPGYIRCPETGYTGWSTVLSLTQGLQQELGITPTVQSFGATTLAKVKARNTLPRGEQNLNLLGIYKGALWCKGYWNDPGLRYWGDASQSALEKVYADAGLDYNTHSLSKWPNICRALLRMDQFKLVPGGDSTIRAIQQQLNARYVGSVGIPAMGLVPTDGYYSRDVQQGLVMGLQYELGIALSSVDGNFGANSQAALKSRGLSALTGNLRYLFRSLCYFNSPVPLNSGQSPLAYNASNLNTDTQTAAHVQWVSAFQQFSQLSVSQTNDFATWMQLLLSTGDPNREATGGDCITEITVVRGQALRAAGYRIIGRYLDEDLPPTDPHYLGKALKPTEPQTIIDAGLRFFPIFQYSGRSLSNFTYETGASHARIANQKAIAYRIPAGSCIYFAVDYDALNADIDSNIIPYFRGVRDTLAAMNVAYDFGVYGSRNVCSRVSQAAGARWSMVSGMSWGFSGNLGFPLPANWSLNQIKEFTFQPKFGLDNDVWRAGGDPGVSNLSS